MIGVTELEPNNAVRPLVSPYESSETSRYCPKRSRQTTGRSNSSRRDRLCHAESFPSYGQPGSNLGRPDSRYYFRLADYSPRIIAWCDERNLSLPEISIAVIAGGLAESLPASSAQFCSRRSSRGLHNTTQIQAVAARKHRIGKCKLD